MSDGEELVGVTHRDRLRRADFLHYEQYFPKKVIRFPRGCMWFSLAVNIMITLPVLYIVH